MASINYAFKEIISKIVYYGPGLSGKTTNLQFVYRKVPAKTRGELISLATDADRTLYFDFLPVNVGTIQGFSTKFQLYTVPGQVYYNATRKLVLRGVDGIVFVADSQVEKMDENKESLQNLKDNLDEYGYDRSQIPMVIQYNKRDLPNISSIEELEKTLNPGGMPHFEAVAVTGDGVFRTLKAISKLVLEQIRKNSSNTPKIVEPATPKPAAKPESSTASNKEPVAVGVQSEPPKAQSRTEKEPEIIKQSSTHTNVVVSDMPDSEERFESEPEVGEDIEETTEKSVLKDESENASKGAASLPKHPDVIMDDSSDESETLYKPLYGGSVKQQPFDEEATQISNLKLKEPLILGKPQMAESRKVKGRKGILGLFGGFKKRKK